MNLSRVGVLVITAGGSDSWLANDDIVARAFVCCGVADIIAAFLLCTTVELVIAAGALFKRFIMAALPFELIACDVVANTNIKVLCHTRCLVGLYKMCCSGVCCLCRLLTWNELRHTDNFTRFADCHAHLCRS